MGQRWSCYTKIVTAGGDAMILWLNGFGVTLEWKRPSSVHACVGVGGRVSIALV